LETTLELVTHSLFGFFQLDIILKRDGSRETGTQHGRQAEESWSSPEFGVREDGEQGAFAFCAREGVAGCEPHVQRAR